MANGIENQIEKIDAMLTKLKELEDEAEQLVADLDDEEPEVPEIKRRFITTFESSNQHLQVEYEDPAGLPKRKTTFDRHQENQTVPYRDPALLPKTRTTHDAAVEQLTQQAQQPTVGSVQVLHGAAYIYNGKSWTLL